MTDSVSFQELRLPIQGMTCGGCATTVRRVPQSRRPVVFYQKTCGGCATTVRRVLTRLPEVQEAIVDLSIQEAQVTYNPALVGWAEMAEAVTKAGYIVEPEAKATLLSATLVASVHPWQRPILFSLLAMVGLMALYLGIVSLAEGWTHAVELLIEDVWLVGPIIAGFGIQVGLYTYLRTVIHAAAQGTGALAGAGGGTSTAAMVACCAHHVTDIMPLLGLSAAAAFLAEYRIPFMVVGLATNLIGIGVISFLIIRHRRCLLKCNLEAQRAASTCH